jgi:superfamily I DNA/RNA helicase
VSYRCAKAIVKKAQEYVPHIESHEFAHEGLVTEMVEQWPLKNFLSTDAILCRNTRPLIGAAFILIRNKIACRVLGRDIGQGLVKLVKKMKAFNVLDLTKRLTIHRQKEAKKFIAQGKEDKLAALDDKLETLQVFMDEVGIDAQISELVSAIEALFSDDSAGRLTLSTVHKAKGLEFERVFILDPFLMPSRYAKQDWQKIQESNIAYVAVTRAKLELYYITSKVLRESAQLERSELENKTVVNDTK